MSAREIIYSSPLPDEWIESPGTNPELVATRFLQSLDPLSARYPTFSNPLAFISEEELSYISMFHDIFRLTLSEATFHLFRCRGYLTEEISDITGLDPRGISQTISSGNRKIRDQLTSKLDPTHFCIVHQLLPPSIIETAEEFLPEVLWESLTAAESTLLYALTRGINKSTISHSGIESLSRPWILSDSIHEKLGFRHDLHALVNYSNAYFPKECF